MKRDESTSRKDDENLIRLLHQRHADLGCTLSRKAAYRLEELTAPRSERGERLKEIEHLLWHALDDSEEDAKTGNITLFHGEDLTKLIELMPEDHP